ncbi:MAG: hypothetical protein M1814_000312 [Vezdaea aestivalis]|nr:MAG: hypothetical protein M1814_000312 [Vezdaea aestivalis]
MALSKSTRILILLGVDSVFFLIELIIGYAVHSLALVADSFHMLNDVLSLCVGLWAVKVANQKSSSRYTYGWQRAETLGALVNGVFLVALCLTIFLEAIGRFVEPQEVQSPVLVLIVGCFGLASNILGLFLFHDHGHSHGGSHAHSHGPTDGILEAEEGHNRNGTNKIADESGRVADVLPQNIIGNATPSIFATQGNSDTREFTRSDEDSTTAAPSSPSSARKSNTRTTRAGHRRMSSGGSRSRLLSNPDDIHIHPASFRNEIIAAGRLDDIQSVEGNDTDTDEVTDEVPNETTSLLPQKDSRSHSWHKDHRHKEPKKASSHGGHSHGDLNMRGVFLHVLGDALGNLGVIGSALFIWLTPFPWRFYADPLISLIITCIILTSAVPLCKAASRILLQAVPAHIDVEDIKNDIQELPGIVSCHHLHVWQLSDTKMIASLHVQVGFDFKGEGSARYMTLAQAIRQCLHEYGIHSSTIQPEFCLDRDLDPSNSNGNGDQSAGGPPASGKTTAVKKPSRASSLRSAEPACLLDCGDECGTGNQCCAPVSSDGENDHSH